jgi:hypothetical protein
MDSADANAILEAWRRSGADRLDPVRFRFIETLARRAAAHEGATRRLLDTRLAQLLAAYDARVRADACVDPAEKHAAHAAQVAAPARPLAALLDRIADGAAMVTGEGKGAAAQEELKSLRHFRKTWDRLVASRRLMDSMAKAPLNAGPLNSQRLVHRSLALMHDLSPEYLSRFVSYVDTLLWLDQATGGSLPMATAAPSPAGRRSTASAPAAEAPRKRSKTRRRTS